MPLWLNTNSYKLRDFEWNIQYPVDRINLIQYPIANTEYPISKGKERKPSRPVSLKLAQKAVWAKPHCSRQE